MRDITFADLQEAAGLGRKLDVDTSSVRLLREIARLRAGLASLRREHVTDMEGTRCDNPECGAEIAASCAAVTQTSVYQWHYPPGQEPGCTCGADEHNARIDALLRGDP